MKKYSVTAVYNEDCTKLLMCMRSKNPYKGLINFTGGRIEDGESEICGAYRELFEETGITSDDITLTHIMTNTYIQSGTELYIYAGKLNKNVAVYGDENELIWVSCDSDFFDLSVFAGDGNIGHIIEIIGYHRDILL